MSASIRDAGPFMWLLLTLSVVALAPGLTNQTMRIYADRFNFDYGSNLITYSSQVRVEDPQMDLACETLTLTRTTIWT